MPIVEIKPEITDVDLARLLGGPRRTIPDAIKPVVAHWREKAPAFFSAAAIYSFRRIESSGKGAVKIDGGPEFHCGQMAAGLKDCKDIVCFLATLGPAIDSEIARLNAEGNLSEAFILDTVGSAAAENMGLQLALRFEEELKKDGKSLTWYYSPGACGWDVEEQKLLFPLLDHEKIGVNLTDSCLMTPKKSVSGLVGILPYPSDESVAARNPCTRCGRTDCYARRD